MHFSKKDTKIWIEYIPVSCSWGNFPLLFCTFLVLFLIRTFLFFLSLFALKIFLITFFSILFLNIAVVLNFIQFSKAFSKTKLGGTSFLLRSTTWRSLTLLLAFHCPALLSLDAPGRYSPTSSNSGVRNCMGAQTVPSNR